MKKIFIFSYYFFPVTDDSDEPTGLTRHLPRRLLAVHAEQRKRKRAAVGNRAVRLENDSDTEDEDEQRPVRPPRTQWTPQDPGLVGVNTPEFIKPVMSDENREKLEDLSTAYDYYKLFQSDAFANEVVFQSRLYAVHKGLICNLPHISRDTYRCMEAVLLHSGYHSVPRRKMLWELKQDCHNNLVADNIRRDTMDAMLQCLHFRDNAKIYDDGYFKVRPIFANLNKAGHWFVDEGQFSVDEVMIPYFGRHSSKQYIHGKPIRYGYKVWSICTSGGSGVWFEPYCGRDTRVEDMGLGHGPNVVLQLVEKASLLPGSELFFDNLFTSFPLLDNLSARNIAGTGTVRQNR